jgi:AraC-like DNA-binding protein
MDYFLDQMSRFLHTKIRIYTPNGILKNEVCPRQELDDSLLFCPQVEEALLSVDPSMPLLSDINYEYSYASIRNSESLLVAGPVRTDSAYQFHTHFHIHFDERDNTMLSSTVFTVDWNDYLRTILLLTNLPVSDTADPDSVSNVTEYDLIGANCLPKNYETEIRRQLTEELFQSTEKQTYHNPYDQELRETSAIENGDLEMLKKSLDEDFFSRCGKLSKNALRNSKNLAIVAISNASRAAIRGGVSPETAFTLSDLYINQIEEAKSDGVPLRLVRNAEYQYALLVNEIKESQTNTPSKKENEHIINCKNYIFQHLHDHIFVKDIAEALALNMSYLSDLFKKTQGMTLSEYILKQKLIRVKNLLIYSNYSYAEIAEYMGFSSQSHLGKQFKEETGMTLKEYRRHYQMQEFIG